MKIAAMAAAVIAALGGSTVGMLETGLPLSPKQRRYRAPEPERAGSKRRYEREKAAGMLMHRPRHDDIYIDPKVSRQTRRQVERMNAEPAFAPGAATRKIAVQRRREAVGYPKVRSLDVSPPTARVGSSVLTRQTGVKRLARLR